VLVNVANYIELVYKIIKMITLYNVINNNSNNNVQLTKHKDNNIITNLLNTMTAMMVMQ
jgi:hypothetical protein